MGRDIFLDETEQNSLGKKDIKDETLGPNNPNRLKKNEHQNENVMKNIMKLADEETSFFYIKVYYIKIQLYQFDQEIILQLRLGFFVVFSI